MRIDWGDGNVESFTGTGERTNAYSGAGVFTLTLQVKNNNTTNSSFIYKYILDFF